MKSSLSSLSDNARSPSPVKIKVLHDKNSRVRADSFWNSISTSGLESPSPSGSEIVDERIFNIAMRKISLNAGTG